MLLTINDRPTKIKEKDEVVYTRRGAHSFIQIFRMFEGKSKLLSWREGKAEDDKCVIGHFAQEEDKVMLLLNLIAAASGLIAVKNWNFHDHFHFVKEKKSSIKPRAPK